ncbi:hypothetical protein FE257_010463 [Aspergillus nanangensis]|uniref:Uncharacterized protein n=1 Tax=Aspergillus nanangensis TaxID=2582783 RepID=A0AAD4CII9_ASPNN|nr:hypothetical protein FE257_010463 [Aspergillus nanangensis]
MASALQLRADSQQQHATPSVPPASLGGIPSVLPDIPICAVFLVLYVSFAATNMTIFQRNKRRGHKFVLSVLLFGFSMARITTLVLRIVWATRNQNSSLAIAANIFVNAGILIVYIINVILGQRILRGKQPAVGWNRGLRIAYKILYASIVGALAMVITSLVVSINTTNLHTQAQCRDVQLAAITYLLVFTCLPLVHILVAFLMPRSAQEETFGQGSLKSKAIIVALSSCICMLIAGFKAGTIWSPARPAFNPAWYHSKACFYAFNFLCEILVLTLLVSTRFDRRFFVPNGCNQPGDYTRLAAQSPKPEDGSEQQSSAVEPKTNSY